MEDHVSSKKVWRGFGALNPHVLGTFRSLLRATTLRALGSLLGFAATFLVTAVLGPEHAGTLYASIAWSAGIAILARWGMVDRILIELPPLAQGRRAPLVPAVINRDIARTLALSAAWLAGLAICWQVAALFDAEPALDPVLLMALAVPTAFLQLFSAVGKAVGHVERSIFFEFVLLPLVVILVAAAARFDLLPASRVLIGATYVAGTALAAGWCFWTSLWPRWHARRGGRSSERTRQRDWNFGLIDLSNFLNGWLAILVLPFLLTSYDVGIFNLAFRFTAAIGVIAGSLYMVVIPRLSVALNQRDEREWKATVRNTRLVMALAGLAFAAGTFIFGPLMLSWAGKAFVVAKVPLYIMAGCFALGVALGPGSGVVAAAGREDIVRTLNIASTVLAVVLLVPMVLAFGLIGAALVTGLTYLLLRALLLYHDLKMQKQLVWSARPPRPASVPEAPLPKVSVVCIFHNEERFLEEAVESVLSQTYPDYELLLVDDGSVEASTRIAADYARRFPARIRYLEHPGHANRGMSATRNLGLTHAHGELIAFIDADDVWLPHKLAEQVALMQANPQVAAVCGAVLRWKSWDGGRDRYIFSGHMRDACSMPPDTSLALYPIGIARTPPPSVVIIRRSAIEEVGGFDERFTGMCEDQAFFAKIFLHKPIYFSTRVWLHYRRHEQRCVATARREGRVSEYRRFFFAWLDEYLASVDFPQKERVLRAISRAHWREEHPILGEILAFPQRLRYRLAETTHRWPRRPRVRLQRAAGLAALKTVRPTTH
jgi:glycosyltransferase involved in cell wall biosynthesis